MIPGKPVMRTLASGHYRRTVVKSASRLGWFSAGMLTSAVAWALACSSHENFFGEQPERGGRAGAAGRIAAGAGRSGAGAGGSSGSSAGKSADNGGRAGTAGGVSGGGGVSGSAGTTSVGSASGESGAMTGSAGEGGQPCVPTPEVCDGVSNGCDDQIDEGGVCPAGCTARTRDGHVYLLCLTTDASAELDYVAATAACANAGSMLGLGVTLELARLESADENDFAKAWIAEQATTDGMIWFGANDIDEEGRWVWGRGADAVQFFAGSAQGGGTPVMGRFNDFADGEPNSANGVDEDCGALDSDFDWQWNDLACGDGRLGYLCEQTE
jgi:Lectin C-type domain